MVAEFSFPSWACCRGSSVSKMHYKYISRNMISEWPSPLDNLVHKGQHWIRVCTTVLCPQKGLTPGLAPWSVKKNVLAVDAVDVHLLNWPLSSVLSMISAQWMMQLVSPILIHSTVISPLAVSMCRWPLRAPIPLWSIVLLIIDPILIKSNFRDPNLSLSIHVSTSSIL